MTVSEAAREPGAREIVRSHRVPRAQYLQVKGDNLLWLYQMVEGGGSEGRGRGNDEGRDYEDGEGEGGEDGDFEGDGGEGGLIIMASRARNRVRVWSVHVIN